MTGDNLRKLTLENHKNAERTAFLRRILKKNITPYQYYLYLSNQFLMYSALEYYADKLGIFDGVEEVKRSCNLRKDIEELEREYGFETPVVTDAAQEYYEYVINDISEDYVKLLAHLYVRHVGDLSGGQIIKKLVPGSGNHYEFDCDVETLKQKFRKKMDDTLADEAKVCFEMIEKFLKELETRVNDLEEFGYYTTPNRGIVQQKP